jgi:hypothetical protein
VGGSAKHAVDDAERCFELSGSSRGLLAPDVVRRGDVEGPLSLGSGSRTSRFSLGEAFGESGRVRCP